MDELPKNTEPAPLNWTRFRSSATVLLALSVMIRVLFGEATLRVPFRIVKAFTAPTVCTNRDDVLASTLMILNPLRSSVTFDAVTMIPVAVTGTERLPDSL